MSNATDYSNWKKEKIDGRVYYMSPSANPKHSEIIGNLYILFKSYFKGKQCKVFMDNIDIYLDEHNNYVIPDMSVLCDPTKFTENGYHGVPSLIVEVISPTSLKRDKGDKFELYEKYGVKEYWIVDYQSKYIEQYVLVNDSYKLINAFTNISEWDYNNRLTEEERKSYTTIISPTEFSDLKIDINDIFDGI